MAGTLLLADDSITIQKVVELTFAETDHRVTATSSAGSPRSIPMSCSATWSCPT